MSDTTVEYGDGYKESDDFVPNVTDQFGTLDTSGTAGAAHAQIEEISPVFEVAKKQNLVQAAKALDPEDDSVSESMVVLPEGEVDVEARKAELREAGQKAESEPVQVASFRGPAQKQAEESGDDAAAEAQAQQNEQGAGGTEANDAARQTNKPQGDTKKSGRPQA